MVAESLNSKTVKEDNDTAIEAQKENVFKNVEYFSNNVDDYNDEHDTPNLKVVDDRIKDKV